MLSTQIGVDVQLYQEVTRENTYLNDEFIKEKVAQLHKNKPKEPEFLNEDYNRFIDSLTIKEILIYSDDELFQKYIGYLNQILLIKQKSISQNVREFVNSELFGQRKMLILLLVKLF